MIEEERMGGGSVIDEIDEGCVRVEFDVIGGNGVGMKGG